MQDPGTVTAILLIRPSLRERQMIPLRLTNDLIYEYACHEGNYSLANILVTPTNRSGVMAGSPGYSGSIRTPRSSSSATRRKTDRTR